MPEQKNDQAIYQIDDLRLDTRSREVTRDDERIELPKLSFDLFVALIRAAPAVVSIDNLASAVWGDVIVSDETITQRVKMLRDALDVTGDKQSYVETVRGVGYRLRPAVREASVDIEGDYGIRLPKSGPRNRWITASTITLLTIAIVFVFYRSYIAVNQSCLHCE